MFKRTLISTMIAAVCSTATALWAADQQTQEQAVQAPIYGSQLMTDAERNEYRNKMRAAKTQQEREAIRAEHHNKMKERAKEKGVTLPDAPPPRGGMGPGMGGGMGPGMGGGMGPGPQR